MKKKIKKSLVLFAAVLGIISVFGFGAEYVHNAQQAVQVVSERVLVPGGQSVGIKMNVKGVLVVGLEEIETDDSVISPGLIAGLQIGDMILSVNGQPVSYAADVAGIINESEKNSGDRPVEMKVLRKEDELTVSVCPVKEKESGEYKIGIWVKEKIAGIGTLTFYDPQTNCFASLGHGIYESQTGTLLEAGDGQLLRTEVKSIKEGRAGNPGEIRGIFYGDDDPIGKVVKNSKYGIYSEGENFEDFQLAQPMVMAWQNQIEKGDAYILTTIDGDKVEKFDIRITEINRQTEPDSKSMEIEVTDEKLLASCGGIVQGMSGSPIIQNNRIVGAVTHVFVNNPTKGYGIFVEWMIEEAENI